MNLRGITAELIAPETANENPVRHINEGCLRAEVPSAKGVATQSLSSMTEVLSCPLVSGQMARRRTLGGSGQSPEVGDSFQFVDVIRRHRASYVIYATGTRIRSQLMLANTRGDQSLLASL